MSATDKPEITADARIRISEFVTRINALQSELGVTLHSDDGMICLRDTRRTNEWIMADGQIYGEWDAFIFDVEREIPLCAGNLQFEDFDGWDK